MSPDFFVTRGRIPDPKLNLHASCTDRDFSSNEMEETSNSTIDAGNLKFFNEDSAYVPLPVTDDGRTIRLP